MVKIEGDILTIRYYTYGFLGWYLAETHVAVVEASEGLAGIPQTKSGNPKVGQFAILDGPKSGVEHSGYVSDYTYIYDLSD
jgi:hypothetical protein